MNCVVIPAYRAAATILPVITAIGPEIEMIIVVDDGCPEGTALVVANRCSDPRVVSLMHDTNRGVGGAFLTGMRYAIAHGADIIVKIDADGQMDPSQVPALIHPIVSGQGDYVKGDRFFFLTNAASMPKARLIGNLALSFMAKLSSGYWTIMDPTNGFFAIHARVAELLDDERITKRFFFETDLLFHLGLIRAKVVEFPMRASYGGEVSNLRISHQLAPFLSGHMRNTFRRILYRYFFREFSLASIQLVAGAALFGFGLVFGLYHWWAAADQLVPTGTIMIAALTFLIGFQLMLSFLNYDISSSPREPLHPFLTRVPNLAPVTGELAKASASETSDAGPQPVRRQA
ncbi:glycosyltransferase family 2 protein [Bradyrhizobium murdochi]|uniref:glycosyltransferase family 2 protein n=1 Tax=Bradyrhizobium murdochi TaxID=1038859 RepID=UPI00040EFBFF|nr:glycosyltransferase family 2 protein [Bradyrhizobium murdochi]